MDNPQIPYLPAPPYQPANPPFATVEEPVVDFIARHVGDISFTLTLPLTSLDAELPIDVTESEIKIEVTPHQDLYIERRNLLRWTVQRRMHRYPAGPDGKAIKDPQKIFDQIRKQIEAEDARHD